MSAVSVQERAPTAVQQVYRYQTPSVLRSLAGQDRLLLATSGGSSDHPYFFSGWVMGSRPSALAMLLLSGVAGTRFHTSGFRAAQAAPTTSALLENMGFRLSGFARARYTDPVVTSHADMLRLESFSACCSVYARLDLPPAAIDGAFHSTGATNVDFGPDLLRGLAGVQERERFFLEVGASGVNVSTANGRFFERKVTLPLRWIKGFGEVQAIQSRMRLQAELPRVTAVRFIRSLPAARGRSADAWLVPTRSSLRLSNVALPGAIPASGLERLLLLKPLAAYIDRLRLYAVPDQAGREAPTAWELQLRTASLHFVLSPSVRRGFSGEGQLLTALADVDACLTADRLRNRLRWQATIDPASLGDAAEVKAALDVLAVAGAVGYDLAASAHFHRQLPYPNLDRVTLHPRLSEAMRLVDAGAVGRTEEPNVALVTSDGTSYRVRLDDGGVCNCPWYGRHQGNRGPCKHVLAARLSLR